jgi:hypothetical protein
MEYVKPLHRFFLQSDLTLAMMVKKWLLVEKVPKTIYLMITLESPKTLIWLICKHITTLRPWKRAYDFARSIINKCAKTPFVGWFVVPRDLRITFHASNYLSYYAPIWLYLLLILILIIPLYVVILINNDFLPPTLSFSDFLYNRI